MTKLDWEKAKRDEKARKMRLADQRRKRKSKRKKVDPNSMAARKWGRKDWVTRDEGT